MNLAISFLHELQASNPNQNRVEIPSQSGDKEKPKDKNNIYDNDNLPTNPQPDPTSIRKKPAKKLPGKDDLGSTPREVIARLKFKLT